jgi:hypothetical protein
MNVCWSIKDLLAAETGGRQHSSVIVQITSSYGSRVYAQKQETLGGTDYRTYCMDKQFGGDTTGLGPFEFPVYLTGGKVAIQSVQRTIIGPNTSKPNPNGGSSKDSVSIYLPTYGFFEEGDPTITQQGVSGQQCNALAGSNQFKRNLKEGCILTPTQPITISSKRFEKVSGSRGKKICLTGFTADRSKPVQLEIRRGTSVINTSATFPSNGSSSNKVVACTPASAGIDSFSSVKLSSQATATIYTIVVSPQ